MLSGLQVLGTIDHTLQQAINESATIDREIAGLTEQLVRLREQEGVAYRELARLRLTSGGDGSLIGELAAAEQRARALLDRRSNSVRAVDTEIGVAHSERASLLDRRATIAEEAETKAKALADAEKAAIEALTATEPYRQQLAAVEAADRVAHHAEQKTEFAEKDRVEKGKPYEDDELFMYLWTRGYGTPAYTGGFFSRFMDRRVARKIGYDKVRANYTMLQEIPRRLREHAERCRAQADAEAQRLQEMAAAAVAEGEAAKRRAALDDVQARLQAVDKEYEAADARRDSLMTQRAALTGGDDPETRKALEGIVSALKRADVRALRDEARRTPLPDDDAIVAQLEGIEAEIVDTERELEREKRRQAAQRQRLNQLQEVGREYRTHNQRGDAWNFGDTGMLAVLLGEVLQGGLSRDGFRDQMNRRRVRRSPGPFDVGGGFPMPRFPGGWGGGSRGGGMGGGGSGGGGGGGFRTGGGF